MVEIDLTKTPQYASIVSRAICRSHLVGRLLSSSWKVYDQPFDTADRYGWICEPHIDAIPSWGILYVEDDL